MATVLVVDDDPTNREFLRTLLVHRGHEVCEAADGDSALTLAGRQPPDAVITDVLMPGLDGYELARLLRNQPATSRIPIAFSTAHYGQQEIQPLARACGVQDVILKPTAPATVLAQLDALLRTVPPTAGPTAGPAAPAGTAGPAAPAGTAGTVAHAGDFSAEHRHALKSKLLEKASALGRAEDRLHAVIGTVPAGVLLANADGAATYVNARLTELTGLAEARLLGLGWLDALDPAGQAVLRAELARGVPPGGCEHRLAARSDAPRWLDVRLTPVGGELLAVVEDVTGAVPAADREQSLRRRAHWLSARLAETQRVTHAGTWEIDPGTGGIVLSPALCELLRLPAGRYRRTCSGGGSTRTTSGGCGPCWRAPRPAAGRTRPNCGWPTPPAWSARSSCPAGPPGERFGASPRTSPAGAANRPGTGSGPTSPPSAGRWRGSGGRCFRWTCPTYRVPTWPPSGDPPRTTAVTGATPWRCPTGHCC